MRPSVQRPSVPVVDQVSGTGGYARGDLAVRNELHAQLLELSFRGYEECILHLLNRIGYEQVQLTGRTAWRGRTHRGGREIEAFAETGPTRCRVLVQIKQYTRPVSRRFVDELRGAMSRRKAAHAILVTTSDFATPAQLAAQADRRLPVTLMDGSELLTAMFSVGLGVRKERGRRWSIDDTYFAHLRQQFPRTVRNHARPYSRPRRPHTSDGANLVARGQQGELSGDEPEGGPVTWRTHVLAGTSSVWLIAVIPSALSLETVGLALVAAAFGALLPDLDASGAKVRTIGIGGVRPFVPLSDAVYRTWGHRGPLHSYLGLIGAAVVAAIFARSISWPVGLAFWLGYASHLAADACTKSGIPLFSVSAQGPRFHALPAPLRFRTGSQAEAMLLPFLAVATVLLVFAYFPR